MPAKDPAKADIENRFSFHPATEETGPQHDAVRADLKRLALKLHKTLPDGRHKSLALTSLEETMHWANAAIACGPSQVPNPQPPAASSDAPAAPRKAAKRTAKRPAAKKSTRSPRRPVRPS